MGGIRFHRLVNKAIKKFNIFSNPHHQERHSLIAEYFITKEGATLKTEKIPILSLAKKETTYIINAPLVIELFTLFHLPSFNCARVVKWQTRAFKGRMPKGMRVRVPPRADRFAIAKR